MWVNAHTSTGRARVSLVPAKSDAWSVRHTNEMHTVSQVGLESRREKVKASGSLATLLCWVTSCQAEESALRLPSSAYPTDGVECCDLVPVEYQTRSNGKRPAFVRHSCSAHSVPFYKETQCSRLYASAVSAGWYKCCKKTCDASEYCTNTIGRPFKHWVFLTDIFCSVCYNRDSTCTKSVLAVSSQFGFYCVAKSWWWFFKLNDERRSNNDKWRSAAG